MNFLLKLYHHQQLAFLLFSNSALVNSDEAYTHKDDFHVMASIHFLYIIVHSRKIKIICDIMHLSFERRQTFHSYIHSIFSPFA